jgi:hypothetical protein
MLCRTVLRANDQKSMISSARTAADARMTMGVTVSPVFMKSEMPVLHFSTFAVSIHNMPASAPVMVMLAPRLLPMTSEKAMASPMSDGMPCIWAMPAVTGTIMAVIGILLTTLHSAADVKEIKKVASTLSYPTTEAMPLPIAFVTPLVTRPSTTMNSETTKTTTRQEMRFVRATGRRSAR